MTTISAKVIADSISETGKRITTIEARYPRFIHAELMTHRVFSRNARSSRAVPVEKMLREIETDPVVPMFWGKNQKGMQASEECDESLLFWIPETLLTAESGKLPTPTLSDQYRPLGDPDNPVMTVIEGNRIAAWLEARNRAVDIARAFSEAGYHKQVVNRLLEPFMHIDVLITATEWSNFLALRDHEAAEPHIQVLAREIKRAMGATVPQLLDHGEWHLPYIDADPDIGWSQQNDLKTAIKLSVARCARISYAPFDGDASIEAELRRYDLLVGSHPMHASPAEHQATPDLDGSSRELHGNFIGWIQYRKTLKGENQ